jgi:glycosyltransferase involved in cell wall biosynthesis/SAM-dependent methyltransferase
MTITRLEPNRDDQTLVELYAAHTGKVSDKWSSYLAEYERLFAEFRNRPVRILEIGVQNGGSLEIAARYFSNVRNVIGCDIDPACGELEYDDPRISVVVGDINAEETRREILDKAPEFDIIIDDGSHHSGDVVRTFSAFFPYLANNGIYIVEDLHCSYWQEFEGGLYDPFSSLAFFKRIADAIHHEHWGIARGRTDILNGFFSKYGFRMSERVLENIHSVLFINSLCVVRKAAPQDNVLNTRIIAGSVATVEPRALTWHSRPPQRRDQSTNEWSARSVPPDEERPLLIRELDERDKEIQRLKAALAKREEQIDQLTTAAGERDRHIEQLHAIIAGRDRSIEELHATVGERDRCVEKFHFSANKAEAERDAAQAALTQRTAQLESVQTELARRMDELSTTSQARDGLQAEINRLNRQLGSSRQGHALVARYVILSDQVLDHISNSLRWRASNVLASMYRRLVPHALRPPAIGIARWAYRVFRPIMAWPEDTEELAEVLRMRHDVHSILWSRSAERSLEAAHSWADKPRVSVPAEVPRALSTGRKREYTVAVVAWDAGHNPVGRAYMIADALSRRFNVLMLAPQFPKYGSTLWPPLQNERLQVICFPGRNYPEFGEDLARIAGRLECDAVIACKPRMPSLELGLLTKHLHHRALIVDVDDCELSFFERRDPLDLHDLERIPSADLLEPYGEAWTRYAETLIRHADGLLVSNVALEQKFGGTLAPHARDESLYDPALYDRDECRRELGLGPENKAVFFLGTVRRHKGLVELAEAVSALDDPSVRLCVGHVPDRGLAADIAAAGGGQIITLPTVPFSQVPRVLVAADVVCCLQDPDSHVSRFQVPAKVVDALALGIPVLATETAPLRPFIDSGAVIPVTREGLIRSLREALDGRVRLRSEQLGRRHIFLSRYSYEALANKVEPIILEAIKKPKPMPESALAFRAIHDKLLRQVSLTTPVTNRTRWQSKGYDIVMLWKQNDLGVYGRRVDMLAKYLARHDKVRQVVLQDRPLWVHDLWKLTRGTGFTEHRTVYKEVLSRRLGLRDDAKLAQDAFIYSTGSGKQLESRSYPQKSQYLSVLDKGLRARGIVPSQAIFWVCPVNEWLPQMIQHFRPGFVVCDVVDDQRLFPGVPLHAIQQCEKNYREVLPLADLVLANCEPVQKAMSAFAADVRLLPNAAELDPPTSRPDESLQRLLAIPQPRLGYVGNLESKIDIPLLEHVAIQRPEWQIVLVGSTHTNPDVLRLERLPNVHFMGVVEYDQARHWMEHFDVALMPHLDTELTRSMHPLKTLVYLAARLPVVATRVPNLGPLARYVRVSESPDAFVRQIEHALIVGRMRSTPELDSSLREHSWSARIEQVMAWIEEIETKRLREGMDGRQVNTVSEKSSDRGNQ